MTYAPPDSVVVDRIKRTFSPDELRERAREANLVERERKFDIVVLFSALSFGAAGSDRSIQLFFERFLAMAECDTLSYSTFYGWFSPGFVAVLRDMLDDAIEDLDLDGDELRGRLDRFRDVTLVDATCVPLFKEARDVYAATHDDRAGAKLHVTYSVSRGIPMRWRTTDGKDHERDHFSVGEWVTDSLVLFDKGFYDFWLFDRIDHHDGWFVSRVKDDANFEIVEELRTWPGNSIPLKGKSLQDVLDDLQRQEIDVRVSVSFDRKRGSNKTATRTFRLVGIYNDETDEYHLYMTNIPRDTFTESEIARLYRARWEIELLFKELKSRYGLDEINTANPYIIRALIIMAAISLILSRVIVDELRKLEARQRESADDATASSSRLPRRRCSLAIERHSYLIQLYLMLELGYELPDLDQLLLSIIRNPNPHRPRLREQVESGEC